ncbi:hypothetical protein [Kerstersia similis]|uniref:hypothetical protein n=1 Tax=Kerstersia similis TaxID=206505 RepID=UPI0039F0E577
MIESIARIIQQATGYYDAAQQRTQARDALGQAYLDWRAATGTYGHIERNSPEWQAMMDATTAEYQALKRAKRREHHCRTRLMQAVAAGKAASAAGMEG